VARFQRHLFICKGTSPEEAERVQPPSRTTQPGEADMPMAADA
jgi:hypothetical protein